jgi:hypothetical protein
VQRELNLGSNADAVGWGVGWMDKNNAWGTNGWAASSEGIGEYNIWIFGAIKKGNWKTSSVSVNGSPNGNQLFSDPHKVCLGYGYC